MTFEINFDKFSKSFSKEVTKKRKKQLNGKNRIKFLTLPSLRNSKNREKDNEIIDDWYKKVLSGQINLRGKVGQGWDGEWANISDEEAGKILGKIFNAGWEASDIIKNDNDPNISVFVPTKSLAESPKGLVEILKVSKKNWIELWKVQFCQNIGEDSVKNRSLADQWVNWIIKNKIDITELDVEKAANFAKNQSFPILPEKNIKVNFGGKIFAIYKDGKGKISKIEGCDNIIEHLKNGGNPLVSFDEVAFKLKWSGGGLSLPKTTTTTTTTTTGAVSTPSPLSPLLQIKKTLLKNLEDIENDQKEKSFSKKTMQDLKDELWLEQKIKSNYYNLYSPKSFPFFREIKERGTEEENQLGKGSNDATQRERQKKQLQRLLKDLPEFLELELQEQKMPEFEFFFNQLNSYRDSEDEVKKGLYSEFTDEINNGISNLEPLKEQIAKLYSQNIFKKIDDEEAKNNDFPNEKKDKGTRFKNGFRLGLKDLIWQVGNCIKYNHDIKKVKEILNSLENFQLKYQGLLEDEIYIEESKKIEELKATLINYKTTSFSEAFPDYFEKIEKKVVRESQDKIESELGVKIEDIPSYMGGKKLSDLGKSGLNLEKLLQEEAKFKNLKTDFQNYFGVKPEEVIEDNSKLRNFLNNEKIEKIPNDKNLKDFEEDGKIIKVVKDKLELGVINKDNVEENIEKLVQNKVSINKIKGKLALEEAEFDTKVEEKLDEYIQDGKTVDKVEKTMKVIFNKPNEVEMSNNEIEEHLGKLERIVISVKEQLSLNFEEVVTGEKIADKLAKLIEDNERLKLENDLLKQHDCPTEVNCSEPCCLGDYDRLRGELERERERERVTAETKEKEIVQKLVNSLGLKGGSLTEIIEEIKGLIDTPPPPYSPALNDQNVAYWEEQLTSESKKFADFQKLQLEELKRYHGEISKHYFPSFATEIAEATTWEDLKNIEKKVLAYSRGTNEYQKISIQKSQLTEQLIRERVISFGALSISLLTIVGLLIKLKGKRKGVKL